MEENVQTNLISVQEQWFVKHGIRTDVYVFEGKGALIVPEGAPLVLANVLIQIPYYVLKFGQVNIS